MSGPPEEHITCEQAREELPALLYHEVTDDRKCGLEAHLRTCEPCRAELEAHRRTLHLLDQWMLEPGQRKPGFPVTPQSHGMHLGWFRPLLVGAAAALVAFTVLSLCGASISRSDGQWVISLGRPHEDPAHASIVLPDGQRRAIRSVVDRALDRRLQDLLAALESDLAEMVQGEQRQRLLLASAVEEVRDADMQRFGAVIEALVRRQVEAERDVERFQAEMIAWKNTLGQNLDPTHNTEHSKENS
jgi:hypothetical protein